MRETRGIWFASRQTCPESACSSLPNHNRPDKQGAVSKCVFHTRYRHLFENRIPYFDEFFETAPWFHKNIFYILLMYFVPYVLRSSYRTALVSLSWKH